MNEDKDNTPLRRATINPTSLGQAIRSRRLDAQLNQRELGALLDRDRSAVCRLEAGQSNPTWSMINRLAIALECPVDDLVVLARMFERVR
jgi:transcriptional regulator with XRE-family HTH domain